MKNSKKIEKLRTQTEIDESNISKSYSEIKTILSPREICTFLSEEFDRFYCSVKSKSIEDKCISFHLFRHHCNGILTGKYFYLNYKNNDHLIHN